MPTWRQAKGIILTISSIFHDYKGGFYSIPTVRVIVLHASILSNILHLVMSADIKIHHIEPPSRRDYLTNWEKCGRQNPQPVGPFRDYFSFLATVIIFLGWLIID